MATHLGDIGQRILFVEYYPRNGIFQELLNKKFG
jgi:hypothetical protein